MRYKKLIAVVATLSVFCGVVVASNTHATGVADQINVTIPVACSLTSIVDSAHTTTVENSAYEDDIGETTFKVFCNDSEGFAVYAVGYTNDIFGNNTLKPTNLASSYAIATGTATSGDTSNWAMKLTAVTGTYAPTLETDFNTYRTVPAEYTKVASYSSNTDATTGSSFKSTYAVYASPTQLADNYSGKVKYTVMHPASESAPVEISQLTYMQDFKSLTPGQRATVLNSMEYNTTYDLIDNRDNKTYQIVRLKDDNIWMAENLDLGRTALTTDLTSSNTNLLDINTTITASTLNNWVKSSGTNSYTTAELIPVTGTDSASSISYGALYNFCAASAGTICADQDSNSYDAISDLCPAGWRLPTGGSSGEFQSLYNLADYNTNAKMRAPIVNGGTAFALAGYFNGSASYQGSYGYYWSSTRDNGSNMHILYLNTSDVSSATDSYRDRGYSVRCVVKNPRSLTISYGTGVSSIRINDVTVSDGETIELEEGFPYLIAMTPSAGYRFVSWSGDSEMINSTEKRSTFYTANDNATITANASYVTTEIQNLPSSNCTTSALYAKDNRDGHVYTIQRLADGNCWMMDNLDLGRTEITTDLTSQNTNLTTTITAQTFNGWLASIGAQSYTSAEFIPLSSSNTDTGLDIDPTSGMPYGTLYNYCAASANTICTDSGTYVGHAQHDLCPAGWRLPTGGDSGEFSALYNLTEYNSSDRIRASISNNGAAFALAGAASAILEPRVKGQGVYGYYWSSTARGSSDRYILSFSEQTVYPNFFNNRNYTYSMRCILKSS